MKFQRVVCLSDAHIPVEMDQAAWDFTLTLLGIIKPTGVLLNGDMADVHGLSTHSKAPRDVGVLQAELDSFDTEIERLAEAVPGSWIKATLGNHEERLGRYLLQKAPELYGLNALSYGNMLPYKKYGIELVKTPYRIGKLFFVHGHELKISGGINPAKMLADKVNDSAMMGHVHRFSQYHKTSLSGKLFRTYSNGCLCTLNPSYLETPNWAQGFSIVDFVPGGMFQVQQVIFWRSLGGIETVIDGSMHRNDDIDMVSEGPGRPVGAVDRKARKRS